MQVTPLEDRTWERFLSKFGVLRQFYRSDSVIKRVTQEVIADAAADNIKYMELRFTPQALNNIVNETFPQVVEWVCDATREAASRHDIRVNLILSMNRHESLAIGEAVLEAALSSPTAALSVLTSRDERRISRHVPSNRCLSGQRRQVWASPFTQANGRGQTACATR